ncbi:CRP/FNR family transcriptional regulator, anaerobic regulatory protein [Rhizobacter sp. OV335]|nr:CRP/FNR family transcriptional regulator, anaerobic regulatory protein [Rhizobacter sp. OV335]
MLCERRNLCLPVVRDDIESVVAGSMRAVAAGDCLFLEDEAFASLYAVRSGAFKTCVGTPPQRGRVTGFALPGDLLGLDAIDAGLHCCQAIALQDSEVCELPYDQVEQVLAASSTLQRRFHQLMSREIVRDHALMRLLGQRQAGARIAAFLLGLSERALERGQSGTELRLPMSREDIGSHLGLSIETVSHVLTRLRAAGCLRVRLREIDIVDKPALRGVAEGLAAA